MPQGTVIIDAERCKGCELCTLVCPQDVLFMDEATINAKGYHPAILNEDTNTCTGCALCAVMCPDVCITVYREAKQKRERKADVVSDLQVGVAPRALQTQPDRPRALKVRENKPRTIIKTEVES